MSQYTEAAVKTYRAAGALAQHLRVTRDGSGNMVVADASTLELGVTERASFAALDDIPVRIRSAQGTVIFTALVAIAVGGDVFAAAGGKVAATGTVLLGTAEMASTADGDFIEVLRV